MEQNRLSLALGLAPWSTPDRVKEHRNSPRNASLPKATNKFYDQRHADLMFQFHLPTLHGILTALETSQTLGLH